MAPDTRYLVGRIAPVRLIDGTRRSDRRDEPTRTRPTSATPIDATEGRGVPAVGADDDGTCRRDEDDAEDQPQKHGLMIPASMGLRFQVPADLDDVHGDRVVGYLPSQVTDRVSADRTADPPLPAHAGRK